MGKLLKKGKKIAPHAGAIIQIAYQSMPSDPGGCISLARGKAEAINDKQSISWIALQPATIRSSPALEMQPVNTDR